jgi:signal transduction histidine kinase
MSVVKSIMDLHGGTIDVANRPEGGVLVTLTFRCAPKDSGAESRRAS